MSPVKGAFLPHGGNIRLSAHVTAGLSGGRMQDLWRDVLFSVRLLARHRGFTLTSIVVLALGIGVNAGVFGLINTLLLRPRVSAPGTGELVGLHSLERDTTGG